MSAEPEEPDEYGDSPWSVNIDSNGTQENCLPSPREDQDYDQETKVPIPIIIGSQIVFDSNNQAPSPPVVVVEGIEATPLLVQTYKTKRKSKPKKAPKTNSEIIRQYLPTMPFPSTSQQRDSIPGTKTGVQKKPVDIPDSSPRTSSNSKRGNNTKSNYHPAVTEMLSNGPSTSKKQNRQQFYNNKLSEESKAKIETTLEEFMRSHNREITFPPDLTSAERKWLHHYALKFGCKSASHGVEPNRRITLMKGESQRKNCVPLILAEGSVREMEKLIKSSGRHLAMIDKNPNKWLELSNIRQPTVNQNGFSGFSLTPKIPPQPKYTRHTNLRKSLPIFDHRDEIINLLFEQKAKVICVKGATGSGKTTQVPQFILEEAHKRGMPVQIVSTVPRRIAAISLADRVAEERGEMPGSTVGYRIRFESNVSHNCLLTYCTTGVLLRWFSTCDPSFESCPLHRMTHLILDEVHERDKLGDFLITVLKRVISYFPNLQLIIMGADLNLELFTTYFGGADACPVLNVEGRLFPINTLFLEDFIALEKSEKKSRIPNKTEFSVEIERVERTMQPDLAVQDALDHLFDQLIVADEEKYFHAILNIFTKFRVSYNYQHSKTGETLLSICKKWGRLEVVKTLKGILKRFDPDFVDSDDEEDEIQQRILFEEELKKELLIYKAAHPDSEVIDFDFLMRIITYVHETRPADEAILVFLPGFEDLCYLSKRIRDELNTQHVNFVYYLLHSSISSKDQKAAFQKPKYTTRKILISTNIAETSLTFDDVVHVIDSGRVKEKSFNSASRVSTLQNVWISKASANQRQGRAGRCRQGWCFRLYTRTMYDSFKEFTVPELLRLSLSELCLAARKLLPMSESVASLFTQTPEPPAETAVNDAIEDLIALGAFTDLEQLTPLGHHLSQLPVDPNLGKALLLAVVFRCLDPVLTIVAFLSHRDPFILPITVEEKESMKTLKRGYAMDPFSDLSVLPRLFKEWERVPDYGRDAFCRRNFLSPSSMTMIGSIRKQLLKNLGQYEFVNTTPRTVDPINFNISSENWAIINGVLTSCLLPNICEINRSSGEILNGSPTTIRFNASSITDICKILNKGIFDWLVYTEMSGSRGGNRINNGATTTTAALILFGNPSPITNSEDDESYIDLLNWIRINGDTKILTDFLLTRKLLTDVLNQFYCFPGRRQTQDTLVLGHVKSILNFEFERCFRPSGNSF